ncbi:23S rRNA (adenine(2030)-N(6))-methyltransferase RlmJ [Mesorhizobium microcysteis]|uniref:Ribosomal RNA large subunit methyltransferase J n=1 Tax=Neoaquamicrobium microcysteis TaxID=2682781 RepID=A0A5D4GVE3_9HYPH|nr:23S rRNA (adenine(2030)-N(6))-methyltransferase RlmJ [Mesorhizobium microcysteis]TYR32841.1 23S rRNA (adenine(2030)-N(6))-methyltransferase RlmJ [Mesorhizobium microcysteis]
MNYRHVYHAGNFADVVKHVVLTRILEYLKRKPGAFRVIDTHAGVGLYDLSSEEAQKTGEWREGIGRLLSAKLPEPAATLIAPYLEAVRAFNVGHPFRYYPGSPVLTKHLLRGPDRLTAIELHPADSFALKTRFAGDWQVRVLELDGWLALGAHVPPKEKRGLVIVDPPFEKEGELERLVEGLRKAHRRWPGGTYALWYPIKDFSAAERFRQALRDSEIPKVLDVVLEIRLPSREPRLDGTGMIVVNPPFILADEMAALLPALRDVLAEDGKAYTGARWLTAP